MNPKDFQYFVGKEHSILLPNHRYETEIFMITTVLNFFGCLGNFHAVCKKSLQYLPFVGWLCKLHEYIFLERNFELDKKIISKNVQSLIKHTDPVTITMFVEGTRFTEEKHKISMQIAAKKGLPELKHHLLPRTRGFTTFMETVKNGSKCGLPVAVYDALIFMESSESKNRSFSFLDQLRGNGQSVKLLLRRYPIENIPSGEIECANWLHKIYQEKDELMKNCLNTGNFAGNGNDKTVNILKLQDYGVITVPKPLNVLLVIGGWNGIWLLSVMWKVMNVFASRDSFQIIAFVAITVILNTLCKMFTSCTQIKAGSSYGKIYKK